MRIGFFSWETKNSISVGGVAAVVTELAEALAGLGHEVHVFTRIGENQPEHEEINGVHEHRVITPGMEDFIEYMDHMGDSIVSCYHWVREEYGEFDVLHGHDWHIVNALANIKHNTGFRNIVWSAHSTEFGRNGNNFAHNWWSGRIRHREWLGGYIAGRVTTVSRTMKKEVSREYQVPEEKISVIYNGINVEKFKGKVDAGKVKKKIGIHPFAPLILFLGRVAYQKGPDLLVEAIPKVLKENWDAKFVYAGTGDMLEHIKGRSMYLGVQDSVRVLGYVSNQDRWNLFHAADIVCIPSRNEPFGIITLESWACGTPVVACDTGGPSEIIDNFRTGVKVYQTPDSIAWGLNYMLGDKTGEALKRMGAECEREAEKYDWHKLAQQYLKVYESLLS
ncbi:MAG: glycosyltransferase [Candidatus Altiarchaeales archaeon]|nr:glycosyltransferase [Candidatus Altiarchaeales archaeon]